MTKDVRSLDTFSLTRSALIASAMVFGLGPVAAAQHLDGDLAVVVTPPLQAVAGASIPDGEAPESAAAEAPAEPSGASTVFTPSLLAAYGGGSGMELGLGLSLRLEHYPSARSFRIGGFTQGEVQTDGTVRTVAGLSGGLWMMGMELGLAYRSDTGDYFSSLGVHIGKNIVIGPVTIGGRITIPFVDFVSGQPGDGRRVQGIEGQVVLTIGLPTVIDGAPRQRSDCGCHRRRR